MLPRALIERRYKISAHNSRTFLSIEKSALARSYPEWPSLMANKGLLITFSISSDHPPPSTGCHKKSVFFSNNHSGNPADFGENHRHPGRHRLHDDGRKFVHAAVGINHTRQHKNIRCGEPRGEFRLCFCARQYDSILQRQFIDLPTQLAIMRAFTYEFTAKRLPAFF